MCRTNVRRAAPREGIGEWGVQSDVTLHRTEMQRREAAGKAGAHLHLPTSGEQKINEVNVLHYNIHEAVGHPSRVQAEADINTLNLDPEPSGPNGE